MKCIGFIPRHLISTTQKLSHFFGSNGFYLREPFVRAANLTYNLVLVLFGISPFVSIPSEAWGGFQMILLSQAVSGTGIGQMAMNVGWAFSIGYFVYRCLTGMVPFFQAQILTQAAGTQAGLQGDDQYPPTGRGFELEHKEIANLFRQWKSSHLYFSMANLFLACFGVMIWQS